MAWKDEITLFVVRWYYDDFNGIKHTQTLGHAYPNPDVFMSIYIYIYTYIPR